MLPGETPMKQVSWSTTLGVLEGGSACCHDIHAQGHEHNGVTKHRYNVDIPKLHCSNPHFFASSGTVRTLINREA